MEFKVGDRVIYIGPPTPQLLGEVKGATRGLCVMCDRFKIGGLEGNLAMPDDLVLDTPLARALYGL